MKYIVREVSVEVFFISNFFIVLRNFWVFLLWIFCVLEVSVLLKEYIYINFFKFNMKIKNKIRFFYYFYFSEFFVVFILNLWCFFSL